MIRPKAQPPVEYAVDGGEVQPIVNRQQQESHEEIADDESQAGLQIGHVHLQHHARHRDERDARNGGSNHAKSHHIPRRLTVAPIERFVGGTP